MIFEGTISVLGSNSRFGTNYGKDKIYRDIPIHFIKLDDKHYIVKFLKKISVIFEKDDNTCIDVGNIRLENSHCWYFLEKGIDGIFRFVFDLDQEYNRSERSKLYEQLPADDKLINIAWDYICKLYKETDRNNMRYWQGYNELELKDTVIDNRPKFREL